MHTLKIVFTYLTLQKCFHKLFFFLPNRDVQALNEYLHGSNSKSVSMLGLYDICALYYKVINNFI